ncbi:MAG: site-specific integrase, partial [Myxococcales bacterium]|nr:site-specific integrase [Myxococcales bacterium]
MRMQWDWIDFDKRTLTVRFDKAGRSDTIPLHAEAIAALLNLRRWREEHDMLGANVFFKVSHNTLSADMGRAGVPRKVNGQGGQWHCFRKAMTTAALASGADPLAVSKAMRHANLSQLSVYDQRGVEAMRSVMDSVAPFNGILDRTTDIIIDAPEPPKPSEGKALLIEPPMLGLTTTDPVCVWSGENLEKMSKSGCREGGIWYDKRRSSGPDHTGQRPSASRSRGFDSPRLHSTAGNSEVSALCDAVEALLRVIRDRSEKERPDAKARTQRQVRPRLPRYEHRPQQPPSPPAHPGS